MFERRFWAASNVFSLQGTIPVEEGQAYGFWGRVWSFLRSEEYAVALVWPVSDALFLIFAFAFETAHGPLGVR